VAQFSPACPHRYALTGREHEPAQRVSEFVAVIGRRGGKSRAMAVLATYIAGLCDHSDALVPGERGILLCIALDQRVAKVILDYAQACFEHSPILRQLSKNRTADALELTNGLTFEVRPASSLSDLAGLGRIFALIRPFFLAGWHAFEQFPHD
jgi:hypothetical protein